jgi:hypothetical protein
MRPFIEIDEEIKRGEEVFFNCRKCGARVEIYLGPRAMTLREKKEKDEKQRKLFD